MSNINPTAIADNTIAALDDIEQAIEDIGIDIPDNTPVSEYDDKIREAGGLYEAGRNAEWSEFWDSYQNSGSRTNYYNAFYQWKDAEFKPKYDIKLGNRVFFGTNITDLKQRLIDCGVRLKPTTVLTYGFRDSKVTHIPDISSVGIKDTTYAFYSCANLHTIDGVKFSNAKTQSGDPFGNCTSLVNLTLYGKLIRNLNLSWSSKLSVESMKSVIACLTDYSGTSSEFANTLTFTDECWARLEADSTSPTGGTWKEYVFALGWLT